MFLLVRSVVGVVVRTCRECFLEWTTPLEVFIVETILWGGGGGGREEGEAGGGREKEAKEE